MKKLIKIPTIDPGFSNPKGFWSWSGLNLELYGKFSEKAQGFISGAWKTRVEKTLKHLQETTGLVVEMSCDWQSIIDDAECTDKICEHWSTYRRDGVNYGYRAFSHGIRSLYSNFWPKGTQFPIKKVHFVNKKGGVPSFTPDAPTFELKGDTIVCTYNMVGWGFPISNWEAYQEIVKLLTVPNSDKGFGLSTKVMASFESEKSVELCELYLKKMSNFAQSLSSHGYSIEFDFSSIADEPLKDRCLEMLAVNNYGTVEFLHMVLKESTTTLPYKKFVFRHATGSDQGHVKLDLKDGVMTITFNALNYHSPWSKKQYWENLVAVK
jgi:hypothetical protein